MFKGTDTFGSNVGNSAPDFGMTAEALKNAQRRVPILSIEHTFTEYQISLIENGILIKTIYLNEEQLRQVEEALLFDEHFNKIKGQTSSDIHRYL